jgi:hypothetical protein
MQDKGAKMNSKLNVEEDALGIVAFACYVCAMVSCGATAYALVRLSLQTIGNLERGFYLTATPF